MNTARSRNGMMCICLIIFTSNLNCPGGNELWNSLQATDFGEYILLMVHPAFMGPQVLDDVVLAITADMPAQCPLATDQVVEKDLLDDIIYQGADLDCTAAGVLRWMW